MTSRTFLVPSGGLTVSIVVDALGLVGVEVAASVVFRWTEVERLIAYDWAMREHLRAGDNFCVRRRERPSFLDPSVTRWLATQGGG